MRISSKQIIIAISSIIIFSYLLIFVLDIVFPEYLGVHNISTLLAFKEGAGILPQSPSISRGWELYMGTTYDNILLFPALLGSLKFDFTVMFASLFISSSTGIAIGYTAAKIKNEYRKFIVYTAKVFTSIPYILIILLILYIARPTETGIIIAMAVGWAPIYIVRSMKFFNEKVLESRKNL
jgi:hypothetical protein